MRRLLWVSAALLVLVGCGMSGGGGAGGGSGGSGGSGGGDDDDENAAVVERELDAALARARQTVEALCVARMDASGALLGAASAVVRRVAEAFETPLGPQASDAHGLEHVESMPGASALAAGLHLLCANAASWADGLGSRGEDWQTQALLAERRRAGAASKAAQEAESFVTGIAQALTVALLALDREAFMFPREGWRFLSTPDELIVREGDGEMLNVAASRGLIIGAIIGLENKTVALLKLAHERSRRARAKVRRMRRAMAGYLAVVAQLAPDHELLDLSISRDDDDSMAAETTANSSHYLSADAASPLAPGGGSAPVDAAADLRQSFRRSPSELSEDSDAALRVEHAHVACVGEGDNSLELAASPPRHSPDRRSMSWSDASPDASFAVIVQPESPARQP